MHICSLENTCTMSEIGGISDVADEKTFDSNLRHALYDNESALSGVGFVACTTQSFKHAPKHFERIGFTPITFRKNKYSREQESGDVTMWYIRRSSLRTWFNSIYTKKDKNNYWPENNFNDEDGDW